MAYNKTFNPDALPAHAEPEQAAQALSQLSIHNPRQQHQQKQQPPRPNQSGGLGAGSHPSPRPGQGGGPGPGPGSHPSSRQDSLGDRRPSPATHGGSYRPNNLQTSGGYNSRPDPRLQSPSPPGEYGQGSQYRQRQDGYAGSPFQQYSQVPQRAIPPPDADSAELFSLFRAANVSGTGSLTMSELGAALVNADFTPFDPLTIRSLMRMFSTSPPSYPSGPVVVFSEFQSLWKFLADWRQLFERFDADGSGKISLAEFNNALVAFGYRLSQPFVGLLYTTFGERHDERRGSRGVSSGMSFDLFVQACIRLKRMTDVFKNYDEDRDGYVTLSFEEFLSEILRLQQE